MPPFLRQSSTQTSLSSTWNPDNQIGRYPELHDPERLRYAAQDAKAVAKLPEKRQLILKKKSTLGSLGGGGKNSKNLLPTLAYLRGDLNIPPCTACTAFTGPFPECVSLKGHFDFACTNCAYNGHEARCSFRPTYSSRGEHLKQGAKLANGGDFVRRSRSRSRSPPRRSDGFTRSPPRGPGGHDVWPPPNYRSFEIKGVAQNRASPLSDRVSRINPQASTADRLHSPPKDRVRESRQNGAAIERPGSVNDVATPEKNDQTVVQESLTIHSQNKARSLSPTKATAPSAKRTAETAFGQDNILNTPAAVPLTKAISVTATSHGPPPDIRQPRQEVALGLPSDIVGLTTATPVAVNDVNKVLDSLPGADEPPPKKQRIAANDHGNVSNDAPPVASKAQIQGEDTSVAQKPEVNQSSGDNSVFKSGVSAASAAPVIASEDRPLNPAPITTINEPLRAPWHQKAPASSRTSIATTFVETPTYAFDNSTPAEPPQKMQTGESTHMVSNIQPVIGTVPKVKLDSIGELETKVDALEQVTANREDLPINQLEPSTSATAGASTSSSELSKAEVTTTMQPPLGDYETVLAEVMAMTPQQQHAELAALLFRMSALHDAISRHPRTF